MIYIVGGIKGGSGKTTIATNLAIFFSQKYDKVLLIDTDEQQTASDFTKFRTENINKIGYKYIQLYNDSVRKEVLRIKKFFDIIIIDTGGRDTSSQRASLSIADYYLVPFLPRSFDIWTLERVAKLIQKIQPLNPSLKSYGFINRADVRGGDNESVKSFLQKTPFLKYIHTPLYNRKVYANASSMGLAINEIKPEDKKATQEFITLFQYINNVK